MLNITTDAIIINKTAYKHKCVNDVCIWVNSLLILKYIGHSLPSNTTTTWHVLRNRFVASINGYQSTYKKQLHTWTSYLRYCWFIILSYFWHVQLCHTTLSWYLSVNFYGYLSIYKKFTLCINSFSRCWTFKKSFWL